MCQGLVKVHHTAHLYSHNIIRLRWRACGTPFAYNDSLDVDTKKTRQLIFNDTRDLNWSLWTTPDSASQLLHWYSMEEAALLVLNYRSYVLREPRIYEGGGGGCFGEVSRSGKRCHLSNVSLLLVRLPSPRLVLSPSSALRSCATLRCFLLLFARPHRVSSSYSSSDIHARFPR